MENKKSIPSAISFTILIVVIILIFLNVLLFGENSLNGPNQVALLLGAIFAAAVSFYYNPKNNFLSVIRENISNSAVPILILLSVGALSSLWVISGIIPTMIYYGLKIIHPSIFLVASLIICSLVSLLSGSSWSTVATVGIALLAIGKTMGQNPAIVAGAIISGAYFGDKMSPMSDTTNIAATVTNTDLFEHIRYMFITTVPNFLITIILFTLIGLSYSFNVTDEQIHIMQGTLESFFFINPFLLVVPVLVIVMIIKKMHPLLALISGIFLSAIITIIFQKDLIKILLNTNVVTPLDYYYVIIKTMTIETNLLPPDSEFYELLKTRGMSGMLNTIWLILTAMIFGGVMESSGILHQITKSFIKLARNRTSVIVSTATASVIVNLTASDQYLSIILPAKLYRNVYQKLNLHTKNLSRTLEDSGTLTSVLVPWNTCGATQAAVLNVSTFSYLPYAFFNYFGILFTIIIAALNYKISIVKNS